MNFKNFNLHPKINAGVKAAGFSDPTPIQASAIPKIMQKRDIVGLAQTGTGKTAAFGLPLLHNLMPGQRNSVRALILAPTRELAEQIDTSLKLLGKFSGLRSMTIYGGTGLKPQIDRLKRGVEIVVACPGRLLDHIRQGNIDLRRVEMLVLDEADQMFDMGFLPDIRKIIKNVPTKRQTLLFSATMPDAIRRLSQEVLDRPETVRVNRDAPADTVSHAVYPVPQHLKTDLLVDLLRKTATESVLIFTRTKHRATRLSEKLGKSGLRTASLQGNLSQSRRRSALNGFRDGSVKVLVATDIAARGIDVSHVSHVINFDAPNTAEAYIHRTGRTGRATRHGEAFTMVTKEDRAMVRTIEGVLGHPLEQRQLASFDYSIPAPQRLSQTSGHGSGRNEKVANNSGKRSRPGRKRRPSANQHKQNQRTAGN